ncbi:hypothetical protein QQZ08_007824 [Neonectria magnoliae]|uniref:Uncharacterized protein n=1 Tax=Neonectria magnoliae TaxID=2732573 RepID=A0ABR1HWS0_9HYPO
MYDGGSAAFFWGTDYDREWSAPNSLTSGTLTINGTQHEVGPKRSTSWYDRQWGVGIATAGWYWFSSHLTDGTRICACVLNPIVDYHKSFATVLRTDGTQEVVTVFPDLKPQNSRISKNPNITYYESYTLTFPEKKSSLKITVPFGKERQHGELDGAETNVALYETHATVEGTWEGKGAHGSIFTLPPMHRVSPPVPMLLLTVATDYGDSWV